MFSTDPPALLI